jgi:hypothetical protein
MVEGEDLRERAARRQPDDVRRGEGIAVEHARGVGD